MLDLTTGRYIQLKQGCSVEDVTKCVDHLVFFIQAKNNL